MREIGLTKAVPDKWVKIKKIHEWITKYQASITTLATIIGFIIAIFAAYYGASEGVRIAHDQELQQNNIHDQNVAKLLYIDVQREEFLLKNTMEGFKNQDTSHAYPALDKTYPDNGIYFAYQNEIASFDYPIAKNITQFYSDLILADMDNEATKEALQNNRPDLALAGYNQFKISLIDANRLCPIIQNELEEKYNISPDSTMTIYR